jgi:hypothetical protein
MRICFKNLEPCPYTIKGSPRTAFVFMPFDKKLEDTYQKGIKKPLEELDWTCHRADEKFDAPEIICTICKSVQEADVIFADVTERNPNVFLEVGLAFGLEKYVVFLSQNPKDIPFDARTFRTIVYDPNELLELNKRIRALIAKIKVVPRASTIGVFEKRYRETKRVKVVPPSPLMEIFVGATNETENWLPVTQENLQLAKSAPDVFRYESIFSRRGYFEFRGRTSETLATLGSDGFFGALIPFRHYSNIKEYSLSLIFQDFAELLFFVVRLLKEKKVASEQTVRLDFHGIRALPMVLFADLFPWRRESAFSGEQDYIYYEKQFAPQEKWATIYSLLCGIYRDICIDLGIVDISDDDVKRNVRDIIVRIDSLWTTYTSSGLQAVSSKEIFGEGT